MIKTNATQWHAYAGADVSPTHSQPCTVTNRVISTTFRLVYPRKGPCTLYTGGWMDLGICLECTEISPPARFDPQTVQPVKRLCSDDAIPIASVFSISSLKRPCLCYVFVHIKRKLGKQAISVFTFPFKRKYIVAHCKADTVFHYTANSLCLHYTAGVLAT